MEIGRRIKEARENKGLTQNELGQLVGVTGSAITNYEKETSHPKELIMYKLFEVLDVDANYLFQDVVKVPNKKNDITLFEYEHIQKYRALDSNGKKHINYELDRETARVKELQQQANRIAGLESDTFANTRLWIYYGKIAAAGKSFEFDDVVAGTIEAPLTDENQKADYTIGVSGNSMEPTYYDSDIVYVKKTTLLEVGDIGIFQKGNGIYIKELSKNGLISHNPSYPPMVDDVEVKVLGKVLGKVAGNYGLKR